MYGDTLSDLMNGPIRKKLNDIPKNVTWGGKVLIFLKKILALCIDK